MPPKIGSAVRRRQAWQWMTIDAIKARFGEGFTTLVEADAQAGLIHMRDGERGLESDINLTSQELAIIGRGGCAPISLSNKVEAERAQTSCIATMW